MIRILLVDDHVSSREALAYLLDIDPDVRVVAQAGTLVEAIASIDRVDIDVAIVDLTLPDGDGIDVILCLRGKNPHAVSIVLTASDARVDLARALESGASGALHKSVSVQEILNAVKTLRAGGSIHSPQEMIELFRLASSHRYTHQSTWQFFEHLTPREKEILQLLVEGFDDLEIARGLSISVRTVQTHVTNLLRKLQVDSRIKAIMLAARYGVVRIETLGRSYIR